MNDECNFSIEMFDVCLKHRCISIIVDKKTNSPTGFALGSIEGRVAIQYVNATNPKDNFTFKCHRSNGPSNTVQDIYAVSSNVIYLWKLSLCYFYTQ